MAENEDQRRVELKSLFSAYSKADAEVVKAQVDKLVARVNEKGGGLGMETKGISNREG